MDLMRRLKSAFIIIIVLPIFMIVAIGRLLLSYQSYSIKEEYNVSTNSEQVIANPMLVLDSLTVSLFNEIKLNAKRNPGVFEDIEYTTKLNDDLSDKLSFIVIRKGDDIIFDGRNEKYSEMYHNILDVLLQYADFDTDLSGGMYSAWKPPFYYKQQKLEYPDGTTGNIFVVTDVNVLVPQIKSFVIQVVVVFIFAIIITAVILILWLYKSILSPLNTLRKATNEIIKGNLDYSISGNPDDEIGQLCCDFEEMRIHLKGLLDIQKQYEHDSRELISNISHDLKTPLTAIKGYAEGILDGVADTQEKQDRYMRTIYTKASDMTSLVDELSYFSEIDTHTIHYNFKVISISRYFEDCIDELSLDLEVKNITLKYECNVDDSVKVAADAEQLKRVINNIIGNSVKYLGKISGNITVRITNDSEWVEIVIEDDGIGISSKDLPYVFDRFYRADASRNSLNGGTGLGLSIVKKIIEEHYGRIWVESEEGFGTRITFIIPMYNEKSDRSEDDEIMPIRKNPSAYKRITEE